MLHVQILYLNQAVVVCKMTMRIFNVLFILYPESNIGLLYHELTLFILFYLYLYILI